MIRAASWLERYQREGFEQIEGWVANGVFELVGAVDESQHEMGVQGGIMEIGIYRGRFFIGLNGLVDDPSTLSLAIDLFADQHLNIDGSGLGDEAIFRSYLERYDRHAGRNVVIMRADSTTLTPADVLSRLNARPRIVSIDGGHTPAHTISDIELARSVVHPQGIVFVDDVLNPLWLGVVEGVITYLNARPVLWPVAVGRNKLLMCPMSVHGAYLKALPKYTEFRKTSRLCGHEVLAV
jgi:hypothetical protein